ncbi:hypothetical protein ACFLWS_00270 [Chloroflexota bacterium]
MIKSNYIISLIRWVKKHMTIVLVALGSSLIALTVFLLGKATDPRIVEATWWYRGAFISIGASLLVYAWALFREWRRERKRDKLEKERERRGIKRYEESQEQHKAFMEQHTIYPNIGPYNKTVDGEEDKNAKT